MVRTAETKYGFFESINAARNPKNADKIDKTAEYDNERFEKTLNSVGHSNREATQTKPAKKNTVREKDDIKEVDVKDVKKETEPKNSEIKEIKNNTENVKTDNKEIKEVVETPKANTETQVEVNNSAAIETIKDILQTVAQKLNIDLGIDGQIPIIEQLQQLQVNTEDIPEEIMQQLIQLFSLFKEMSDAFLNAGLSGEDVETEKGMISAKDALAIGQFLQQETVKLELSFAQLGVIEKIADNIVKNIPEVKVESDTETKMVLADDLDTNISAQQIPKETVEKNISVKETSVETEIQKILEKLETVLNGKSIENKDEIVEATDKKQTQTTKPADNAVKTAPVIEALAELKKETNKADAKSAQITEIKINEIKISGVKAATDTQIKESVDKVKEEAVKAAPVIKSTVVTSGEETAENSEGETSEESGTEILEVLSTKNNNKEGNKQHGGENNRNNTQNAGVVPTNEFVAPVKDASIRVSDGNITAPISIDGVTLEANKFSDSSEINQVSPRFMKLFEKEIVEQVHRTILSTTNKNGNGLHQISLTLNPEKLGEIKLTIQVENGVVSARLNVENSHIKGIIEQNMQNLRDALMQQNLSAGTLDVSVGGNDAQELADKMFNARNRKEKGYFGKEEGVMTDGDLEIGVDTGRRIGTNSFEYFA